MQQTAKPVSTSPSEPLEDTIRTQMADANPASSGSANPTPQGQMQQAQAQLANAQFATLQNVIGKFSDAQLAAALVHVADYRIAELLSRRLSPATPAVDQPVQAVQPAQPAEQQKPEQRTGDRAKVLRSGKIIYNNKMSVADCKIRDISGTGCRISAESTAGLPRHFTLHIVNGDVRHECEVAWRSSSELGVKFIG